MGYRLQIREAAVWATTLLFLSTKRYVCSLRGSVSL